uniref:Uncharacterized protein n=1 Tax=Octopus bimaculoides TaxID=37653 RepID=A0A0L8HR16_OCTBM
MCGNFIDSRDYSLKSNKPKVQFTAITHKHVSTNCRLHLEVQEQHHFTSKGKEKRKTRN